MRNRGILYWAVTGIILSSVWFGMQFRLPETYRVPKCCDAAEYVALAELGSGGRSVTPVPAAGGVQIAEPPAPSFPSRPSVTSDAKSPLGVLFSHSGFHPLGYPVFLAAHRMVLSVIGLTQITQWVTAAAVTTFLLYLAGCLWLFWELRQRYPLHPAALFLLLVHPGIVASAILPLTDSLTVAVLLFFVATFLRLQSSRRIRWATLSGVLLASVIWLRTSLFPSALLLLAVWVCAEGVSAFRSQKKIRPLITIPLIACAAFFVILSPRIIACTQASGHPCVVHIPDRGPFLSDIFTLANTSIRAYTVLEQDGRAHFIFVPDPLLTARFADHCPIGDISPTTDLLKCYIRNTDVLPVLFFKKTVGLFDHFHVNTYATLITPPWVVILMRIFGAASFAGCVMLLVWSVTRWRWLLSSNLLPIFLFFLSYVALSLPPTIESRYGFPLAPVGLIGCVVAAQKFRSMKWLVAIGVLAAVLFLLQTHTWDAIDVWKPL